MMNRSYFKEFVVAGLQFSTCIAGAYMGSFLTSIQTVSQEEDTPTIPTYIIKSLVISFSAQFCGALYYYAKSKILPQSSSFGDYIEGIVGFFIPGLVAQESSIPYRLATEIFVANRVITKISLIFREPADVHFIEDVENPQEQVEGQLLVLPEIKDSKSPRKKTFQQRLEAVNYSGDIPSEFMDGVQLEIMNDPCVLNTGHSLDRQSVVDIMEKGNKKCLITSKPITSIFENVGLRIAIEHFVSDVEKAHRLKKESKISIASEKTVQSENTEEAKKSTISEKIMEPKIHADLLPKKGLFRSPEPKTRSVISADKVANFLEQMMKSHQA